MTGKQTILLVVLASAATGALGWKLAAARAPARSAPSVSEDDFEALRAEVQTLAQQRGRALAQEASARARADASKPGDAPPEAEAKKAPRVFTASPCAGPWLSAWRPGCPGGRRSPGSRPGG